MHVPAAAVADSHAWRSGPAARVDLFAMLDEIFPAMKLVILTPTL